MSSNKDSKEHVNYLFLTNIIATIALICLLLIYYLLQPISINSVNTLFQFVRQLLLGVVPNLITGLVVFLVIYWLFNRRGLIPSQLEREASEQKIIQNIREAVSVSAATHGVKEFYPGFSHVRWHELLGDTSLRIDIVVNYFDSWIKDNKELLSAFFKKPKAELHLYIPDATNDKILDDLCALYGGEYSKESLREKVQKTEQRLLRIIEEVGGTKVQLKVFRLICRPTYALQRLDHRLAVFSAFDNGRRMGVESPAVVVDLHKLPTVAKYFENELEFLQSKQLKS